jgi:hypothetical protein
MSDVADIRPPSEPLSVGGEASRRGKGVPLVYDMQAIGVERLRGVLRSVEKEIGRTTRVTYVRNCLVATIVLQLITIGMSLAALLK